jgi:hypothetical protein
MFSGSPITAYCFIHLVEVLKLMSDEEIVKVANFYFTQLKPLYVLISILKLFIKGQGKFNQVIFNRFIVLDTF